MVETNGRDSVPSWLTKEYLENILRKKNPKINVKSFTAVPPVAAGNNYASLILRAEAICEENGSEKVHSLIIKTIHFNEESAAMMEEYGAHDNEIEMYSKFLPKFQSLLEEIGDHDKLAPESIFVDEKNKAMIFQDMKTLDYKMAQRQLGLDWDHMKIIARKQAKFHACSMVLMEQGEIFERHQKGIFNEDVRSFDPYYHIMCKELGTIISEQPGYKDYGEKIKKMADRVVQQGLDAYKKRPDQTIVLNHGDSWLANMLFKYDEAGHVNDAVLIDFQLCNQASPAFDLIYFFTTSANDEVRFESIKFSQYLQLYHKHLTETLAALKSTTKPPTLFELHQECYQRGFLKFVFSTFLAFMVNEHEGEAEMQMFLEDSPRAIDFRKKAFSNPRALKTMKHFLPIWDAEGLLDPLK